MVFVLQQKTRADKKKEAPKQIFARRYRPGFCVFAGKRWDAVKASFELHIQRRVKTPTTVQVPRLLTGSMPHVHSVSSCPEIYPAEALFWTYCVTCLDEAGLQKGARPKANDNTWSVAKLTKVCDKAADSFLALESTQSPQT